MAELLCAYNVSRSVRPDLNSKDCGARAEFRVQDENYCSIHYNHVIGRVVFCGKCERPLYNFTIVELSEHFCGALRAGGDCMCFEHEYYCTCEQDASDLFDTFEYGLDVEVAEQYGDRVY